MPKKKAAKKKPAKVREKRAKRPRKSVRKTKPVVTAEMIGALEVGVLQGRTLRAIAMELGVDHRTLVPHLRDTIRPAWREKSGRTVNDLLARLDECYRHAWAMLLKRPIGMFQGEAGVARPGSPAWLAEAIKCLQEEAKLLG